MMFDPHANLLATIQALEAQNVLQILAEPNLLAMNGHVATFVAGGEFPFPTLQGGGGGVGQVTISFREFGIKLNSLPSSRRGEPSGSTSRPKSARSISPMR